MPCINRCQKCMFLTKRMILFVSRLLCYYNLTGSHTPTLFSTWPRTWKVIKARWRWSCRPTWMRRLEEMAVTTPTLNPTWLRSSDAPQRTSASWQPPPSCSSSSVRRGCGMEKLALYKVWCTLKYEEILRGHSSDHYFLICIGGRSIRQYIFPHLPQT